jgi:alpha-mannosidase
MENKDLPVYKGDLNPFAIGCYTSMKSIKQPLYKLEHKYFTAEKVLSLYAVQSGYAYPEARMDEALKEILFCQFHDILPGTSIEPVEKDVLARIGHATMIIDNEMAGFFAGICNSLKPAVPEEFPIMAVNPHPFDIDEIVEIELQKTEPNFDKGKERIPVVYDEDGKIVTVQSEKPGCNIREDHRKKIVFRVKIRAGSVKRYSSFLKDISFEKKDKASFEGPVFETPVSRLVMDMGTGMPSDWEYNGTSLFSGEKMRFAVLDDNADPWGMGKKFFDGKADYFELMDGRQASEFAGLSNKELTPVYVSEKGPVRTIVETLLAYNNSRIHARYIFGAGDPGFDVEITVYWMEKDKLLKWIIPVGFNMNCIGRSISGITCCKHRKREFVMRDWLGMKNFEGENSFSVCSDGAYGYDISGNLVRISLLRAPSYAGHPVEGNDSIVFPGRAVKRIDQGVHTFRFRFIPGNTDEIINNSFNDSDLFNNPPFVRTVYPDDSGKNGFAGITISDRSIYMQALKYDINKNLVIRLLNPCRDEKEFEVLVQALNAGATLKLGSKKLSTWVIDRSSGKFSETDLLDRNR